MLRVAAKMPDGIEPGDVGWKAEENQATLGPLLNMQRYLATSMRIGAIENQYDCATNRACEIIDASDNRRAFDG